MERTTAMSQQQPQSVRDRLVKMGLAELNTYGPKDFSVRRVATQCGVSCAAPYKHFQNKSEFLAAIIQYANEQWTKRQQRIMRSSTSSTREKLVLICKDYIKFLVENPYLRSALMTKDESFDSEYIELKRNISGTTKRLVEKYAADHGIPDDIAQIKLFVCRSIIYGAALMIDNGELPNTPKVIDEVVGVIDREFDLP